MGWTLRTSVVAVAWLLGAHLWLAPPELRGGDGMAMTVYGAPRRLGELSGIDIRESSGIAISRRQPEHFWTHNDSGDPARIFAFDRSGRHVGECRVRGAAAIDWEDMASFEWRGSSWLLLADTGDNARRRTACALYLCAEPAPTDREVEAVATVFRYEDGPHDCEAVGFDSGSSVVLLATKALLPQCRVYELAWPEKVTSETCIARHIATVPAMEISPDGRFAVIGTYGDAYLFARREGESWQGAFSRPPQPVALPARRQGESICFGADGRTLYLTSEQRPTPLWEIPAR
jgi:hypothetical protein